MIWLFLWLKQWRRALNQRTIKTIAGFVACAECEGKKVRRKINIGEEAGGPVQEAVRGKNGAGQLIDYRGKKVIAAWRYIPSLDWGMVAKIDTKEAFADVTNLRNLAIMISLLLCVTETPAE